MFVCGWCKQSLAPELEDSVVEGVCVDCVDEYELESTFGQGEDDEERGAHHEGQR